MGETKRVEEGNGPSVVALDRGLYDRLRPVRDEGCKQGAAGLAGEAAALSAPPEDVGDERRLAGGEGRLDQAGDLPGGALAAGVVEPDRASVRRSAALKSAVAIFQGGERSRRSFLDEPVQIRLRQTVVEPASVDDAERLEVEALGP